MHIKLSIVIPVYNVERYIDKCLHSVVHQNISNDGCEIIVVNDGTLDNSMDIVDKYVSMCDNVKVINQQNFGLSVARNMGLKSAVGDYVWFVDSDDWITEDALQFLYILLDKDIDVFAFPLNCIKKYSNKDDFSIDHSFILSGSAYLYGKYPYGATPRFVMKREFLVKNDLFFHEGIFHEDAEYGIRMLYQADQIYISNRSIYNYRIRETGSIMSSWRVERLEDLVKIANLLILFRNQRVPKIEYYNFNQLILWIYISALRFSKGHYDERAFSLFYRTYKKEISQNASFLLTISPFRLKGVVIGILLSISPLLFVKIHNILISNKLR